MEFESFIQKFTNLKDLGNRQFRSACPVCEKNVPNGHHLYIKQGDFGIILLNCKKGCSVDTICSEIQISLKDLFPNQVKEKSSGESKVLIREHIYCDRNGNPIAKKEIYEQSKKKSCFWKRFSQNQWLYGLNNLQIPLYQIHTILSSKEKYVFFVEGEKDADLLLDMGILATTLPHGASSNWNDSYAEVVHNRSVFILPDHDDAGYKYANMLFENLKPFCKTVEILKLPLLFQNVQEKQDISDISDIYGRFLVYNTLSTIIQNKVDSSVQEKDKKKVFLLNDTKEWLIEHNAVIYEDIIKGEDIILGFENTEDAEQISFALPELIYDDFIAKGYSRVSKENIISHLRILGGRNKKNPVLEYIKSVSWDGHDRIQTLIDILGIQEDSLSKVLLKKWLLQTVALQYNTISNSFGADGVLLLTGKQGIGKTSFFSKLAMRTDWFGEGLTINYNDKDTTRRIVTTWIAELGEIETTFKSDISALKAFITQKLDIYRLPYARLDTKRVRTVSLCATCNSSDFLVDTTGNRRFWVVPVNTIDLNLLNNIDVLQLWSQVHFILMNDGIQSFRLSVEERNLLESRNSYHKRLVKGELEVADIIQQSETFPENFKIVFTNVTEWKEHYSCLSKYTAQQIGAALQAQGFVQEMRMLNNKKTRCYALPIPN